MIERVRYGHDLGKNKFEPRYGAVVIPPGDEAKWIPFGNATEIQKNIAIYQKSARGQTADQTLGGVLRALHMNMGAD